MCNWVSVDPFEQLWFIWAFYGPSWTSSIVCCGLFWPVNKFSTFWLSIFYVDDICVLRLWYICVTNRFYIKISSCIYVANVSSLREFVDWIRLYILGMVLIVTLASTIVCCFNSLKCSCSVIDLLLIVCSVIGFLVHQFALNLVVDNLWVCPDERF